MPDERRHESSDLDDYEVQEPSDSLSPDPGYDPLDRGVAPPERWSAGMRYGVTADEQADGESLDQLLAEEEPDDTANLTEDALADDEDDEDDDDLAGFEDLEDEDEEDEDEDAGDEDVDGLLLDDGPDPRAAAGGRGRGRPSRRGGGPGRQRRRVRRRRGDRRGSGRARRRGRRLRHPLGVTARAGPARRGPATPRGPLLRRTRYSEGPEGLSHRTPIGGTVIVADAGWPCHGSARPRSAHVPHAGAAVDGGVGVDHLGQRPATGRPSR